MPPSCLCASGCGGSNADCYIAPAGTYAGVGNLELTKAVELCNLTSHAVYSCGVGSVVDSLLCELAFDCAESAINILVHFETVCFCGISALEIGNLHVSVGDGVLHIEFIAVDCHVLRTAAVTASAEQIAKQTAVKCAEARADYASG